MYIIVHFLIKNPYKTWTPVTYTECTFQDKEKNPLWIQFISRNLYICNFMMLTASPFTITIVILIISIYTYYSSEMRGICLMKCSRETIQNLPYFWNIKTHVLPIIL